MSVAQRVRHIIDTHKTKKNLFGTSRGVDIIITVNYINGPYVLK